MGRTLYEAAPEASGLDLRLRRVESRVGLIEAGLRERAAQTAPPPAPMPPAAPPPTAMPPAAPPPVAPPPVADLRWTEIGSRLEALALKLKLHYEQAGGDGAPRTLDGLRDSIRDAFTATENAVNDEAVRADVREAAVMVAGAVADTLTTVGDDMREALRRPQARKGEEP